MSDWECSKCGADCDGSLWSTEEDGTRNTEHPVCESCNRVCTPLRNRQRIVEEVERRYGRKAGEMITFAPLVPVENVVAFVIDAVEAME